MIIDGKKYSEIISEEIKSEVEKRSIKPTLAVILANDNEASKIYVSNKEKKAQYLGFNSKVFRFNKSVTQSEVIDLIKKLNSDSEVNAILVQLPLFSHLDEKEIIETIDYRKDVDGFTTLNLGRLMAGVEPYTAPCTPKGVIKLIKHNFGADFLKGKNVVVIGRSNIVGKPLVQLLIKEDATVTLAHSKTKNLAEITKTKDIIISATGFRGLIKADMVAENAIIIDVGITRDENNKIKGDVDFENVKDKVSAITPVPGGIGPMTIAMLMENTLELYLAQNKENN